jgi:hypothetical protein
MQLDGSKAMKILLTMLLAAATSFALACSSDNDEVSSRQEICSQADDLRAGIDDVSRAVQSGDLDAADEAVDEVQATAVDLREAVGDAQLSNDVSQSAADLISSFDGLKTTLRQVGQGGGNVVGLVQALEVQLPAIRSAADSLQAEVKSSGCD